jgi:hypothetical protein
MVNADSSVARSGASPAAADVDLLIVLQQAQQLLRPAIPALPGVGRVVERGCKGFQQRAGQQRGKGCCTPLAVSPEVPAAQAEREVQALRV